MWDKASGKNTEQIQAKTWGIPAGISHKKTLNREYPLIFREISGCLFISSFLMIKQKIK